MKKYRKMIIMFIIITMFTFVATEAYNLTGYKLTGGVTYKKYYISSSATSFVADVDTAVNQWMFPIGATNKISFTKTTTYMDSIMDIYAQYATTGTYQITNAWTEIGYLNPPRQLAYPDSNYDGGVIYLNTYNVTAGQTRTVGVAAHEMGHVFGLFDNNTNVNAVMCQEGSGRAVTRAGTDDNNGVNYLYP
jgi:hypothetical protein